MTTEIAYRHGYDASINGSNEINCSFRIFSQPEFTKAWERGKADGDKAKQSNPDLPAPPKNDKR